jgi:feruloyl esterase
MKSALQEVSMRTRLIDCLLVAGALGAAALLSGAAAPPSPAIPPVIAPGSCANLLALQIPETVIKSAEEVAGPAFTSPGSSTALRSLPAFCRVVAVTKPAVTVEVWLPLTTWNGKFQGVGNGGTAGIISYGQLAAGIRRGYATASTDTGHVSKNSADSSWALGRMDLSIDFGYRGTHVMTVDGKAITRAFYNMQPRLSYYTGCSKGGQQGLSEAQRYPDDYDGLVAGDPANNVVRSYLAGHLWVALVTLKDPDSYIPQNKVAILSKAVNDACDTLDGIKDGVLNDPRACKFDPTTLTCKAEQDQATCFTPKQVQAIKDIWAGARNSKGEQIYPGYEPGAESFPGSWPNYVAGTGPETARHYVLADGFLKYVLFADPNYDFRQFSYDRDFPPALAKYGPILDSVDPNLAPLEKHGAKLIVYHGWSDPSIPPMNTVDYYESVVATVGGKDRDAAVRKTQEFFRLFMVPGMNHCSGGPGTDHFDMLTAMENWVEKGTAPDRVVASHMTDGKVDRTRPLCPYPQVALYNGSGSTDDAANFACGAQHP